MKAIIAAGLAVGLLGGCATESQLQLQAMETSERQADARYDVCVSAVFNSREFMPLQKHPRRSHDFTQEQMSDQSLATSDEVQAFRSVYPRLAACQNAFVESLAQSEPDLVSFQNAYYKEGEDDMLQRGRG